jgi:sortase A
VLRSRGYISRPRRIAYYAALTLAVWQLGGAGYVHAKALLAQRLLESAWTQSQISGVPAKPWPWADTTPVARLRLARLDIEQIVLAGDSGRTLAFGPGWAESSSRPGQPGVTVISGHRDTHFSFLRDVVNGDEFELQTYAGTSRYAVTGTQIVDADRTSLALDADAAVLQLVTCYPFDAIVPGGPLRFVVSARLIWR